jgi:hypothetical protein
MHICFNSVKHLTGISTLLSGTATECSCNPGHWKYMFDIHPVSVPQMVADNKEFHHHPDTQSSRIRF